MSKQHLQPPDLFDSQSLGFSQVVTSPPGTLVYVSGQTAWNEKMEVEGGDDLREQAEHALQNLRRALAAAGAGPGDVTSLRIYIVDYTPDAIGAIGPPLSRFFEGVKPSAQTLLGVQALALPALKIEIEATALVDA